MTTTAAADPQPTEQDARSNTTTTIHPPHEPTTTSTTAAASTTSPPVEQPSPPNAPPRWHHKILSVLTYTPARCRWDPSAPPRFSMSMNILFAFAGGFTVANLYYSHPILNVLARDFGVRYEQVAQIPTVMQAGYAAGLLFLCPLGDMLPRRPFVVGLVGFTATLWLGLCLTKSLAAFTAISFIVAVGTVTPQLMLPLVGDLAPPHRRAAALSVVVCGLQLGILIARVLSGTLTNYVTWRAVYWLAFALQYTIFVLLWLFMPDYPATNKASSYFKLLWSIVQMLPRHAVLVQACITALLTSATFTSFWTTVTFLLAGPPYHYTPLVIGLFGLIGIAAMFCAPLFARTVTDRFVPHLTVFVGLGCALLGICLGTYIGPFNVSGPILQAFLLDFGLPISQIANRSGIFSIEPKRRNGVNTAFMVSTFCGQLIGTSAGNHIYARAGWIGSGSASVGFISAALLTMAARGPWETGWIGWRGGWSLRKKDKMSADGKTADTNHLGQPVVRDEEKGAGEKALEETAGVEASSAAETKEHSLVEKEADSSEKSRSSSRVGGRGDR